MSQPPTRCREAVRRLWDYLDDELDDAERHVLEQHLTYCLRCCGELAFVRELQGVLRSHAPTVMPGETRQRLESLIEQLDDDPRRGDPRG